jgi:hypothetical protein
MSVYRTYGPQVGVHWLLWNANKQGLYDAHSAQQCAHSLSCNSRTSPFQEWRSCTEEHEQLLQVYATLAY